MNFSEALEKLKQQSSMARSGWNGKGMSVHLQTPAPESKMTLPYIYMVTAQGKNVPWIASQTDLLANRCST